MRNVKSVVRILNRIVLLLLVCGLLVSACGCDSGGGVRDSESGSVPEEIISSSGNAAPESLPTPPSDEKTDVKVGALLGPTGMGLAWLMQQNDLGQARNNYSFVMEGAPAVLQGSLIGGDLDIAALPTNLAANIYNKSGGALKMIAVSRMSVLHIMNGPDVQINSLEDLRGKTLFTAGQGSTQEYVLSYLLENAGLDPESDLQIEFKSEHAEVAALLAEGKCDAALLPQPFVTSVGLQNPDITASLDITAEWEAASGGLELTMSCIVARTEFIERNPEAVRAFVDEYALSADFARDNVGEAAVLIAEYEILPNENVAKLALPSCRISCESGEEIFRSVRDYLRVLYERDPASVGGDLPDDGFYYPA